MYLIKPLFKTLLKKRETLLALSFSVFPLVLLIVQLFKTNFMQLSAANGSMSCLGFFSAVLTVQLQITIPLIAMIYLITTYVHDEIKSGMMYLYKDIDRSKIINAKVISLLLVYILYFSFTFIFSTITYLLYVNHQAYSSHTFLPVTTSDMHYVVLSILSTICVSLICIFLAFALSVKFSNGLTMLVTIVWALFSFIASKLSLLEFIFPNAYTVFENHLGFSITSLLMMLATLMYCIILYYMADVAFEHIEY